MMIIMQEGATDEQIAHVVAASNQARQVLDCIVNRQLHFIGIDLRRQPDVAVPHQFHGEPLRHAVALQKRRPGVAQRVEIPVPPNSSR